VRAATTDNSFPLTGMTPGTSFNIVGKPAPPPGQDRVTEVQMVGSDYFQTMGIPLLRGRTFTDREETLMSHVVIISEQLARQFFPDEEIDSWLALRRQCARSGNHRGSCGVSGWSNACGLLDSRATRNPHGSDECPLLRVA
jgi:hypothetical protein